MPLVVEYQPPTAIIEAYNEQIRDTPALLTTAYKRNTHRLIGRWITALRIEPPTAENYYPLPYKSARQRRKVHALRRERGGGAYQRTHALSQGWKGTVDPIEGGGELRVVNNKPTTVFVYGSLDTPRQPMFVKIPWLDPFEVSYPFMDEAENVLIETLDTISSPTAGVR